MIADCALGLDGSAAAWETMTCETPFTELRRTLGRGFLGGFAQPLLFATGTSRAIVLRRLFRRDLGRLLVMLALVAVMKLELATLRNEVGMARNIR